MKKICAMSALGSFLLIGALLLVFYAYPRLAVIPPDLDSKVVAENPEGEPATYFSIAKLAETTDELGNQTKAAVDQSASIELSKELGRDVLVVRTIACTDVITVDCSTLRYPLAGTLSVFAIDASSGEPVAWNGASVETSGTVEEGVEFEGLTIKFPFNAQRQTYQFWNADLRRATPVEYVGQTSIDGLRAYEYHATLEPTVMGQIEVPGILAGSDEPTVNVDRVVSAETSYFVEPESGVILSATSDQDSYAEFEGERAFTITDGTFTTPKDAAAETVDTYRSLARLLFLARVVLPIGGIVIGTLLLLVSALLVFLRQRVDRRSNVARERELVSAN